MSELADSTILLVDDNDIGRYATGRILRHAGFTVLEAASGEAALVLAQKQPSLVILDVQLPDINGFEVCRRLKADPSTAAIPVLHLSAMYPDSASHVKGLEGGADGYLLQPIDPPVFLATVRAHLRIRQIEAQRNQLAELLEKVSDAIITTDLDFTVRSWNQGAQKLYGVAAGETIGQTLMALLLPEEEAAAWEEARVGVLETGAWQGHLLQQQGDGTRITVFSSASLVRDERGEAVQVVFINRDVTQVLQAERIARRVEIEEVLEEQVASERRRIARELHDGVRQQLIGIKMLSVSLHEKLKSRGLPEATLMQEFASIVGDANTQVRRLINGLVPIQVDAASFLPALERAAANIEQWYGVPCIVHAYPVGGDLESALVATHAFHIAQEAMTNAAKHSGASEIVVSVWLSGTTMTLKVHDDGAGLPPNAATRGGMGLSNMSYRAELIGADLDISSGRERGTTVTLTLKG